MNTLVPKTQIESVEEAKNDRKPYDIVDKPFINDESIPPVPDDVKECDREQLNPGTVRVTVSVMRLFAGFFVNNVQEDLVKLHLKRRNQFVARAPQAGADNKHDNGCPEIPIERLDTPNSYIP